MAYSIGKLFTFQKPVPSDIFVKHNMKAKPKMGILISKIWKMKTRQFLRSLCSTLHMLEGAGKASTDDINDILNTIKSSDSKSGSDLEDILLSFVKSKSKTSGLSSVLGLLKKQGDAGR